MNLAALRILLVLLLTSLVSAQDISVRRESGASYVSLSDVAAVLGYTAQDSGDSFTVRSSEGILTVFDGSPDFEWTADAATEPTDRAIQSASAPVLKLDDEWFAPGDLFTLFGIVTGARTLSLPDGRSLTLDVATDLKNDSENSSLTELGGGVTGLSFYKSGTAGKDTTSLLLIDMALMARAFPEQQAAIDAALAKFTSGQPLYFVVTAVTNATWEPSFRVEQGGRVLEFRHPANITVLEGDAGRVLPETPVSGVLVLPNWIDLRQPVTVTWSGITATVQYRQ